MNALKIAKEAFAWASQELSRGSELEIFYSEGRGRSVIWSEGKCEDLSQAEGGGTGVRVILNDGESGRQGYAFTTGSAKESVRKAALNALESAKVLPQDPFRKLSKPGGRKNDVPSEIIDPDLFTDPVTEIRERLRQQETRILKDQPLLKSLLRGAFSEALSDAAIVNSNGVEAAFSGPHCGIGAACLAEKNGERQEGGFGLSRIFRRDLNWNEIFDQASRRTVALLGGKPIPSGKTPVIFDPTVACDFLSLVSGMVCADSVQKGKSPFKDKLGERVATNLTTIVDDGCLKDGLGTAPVDDEGVPTQRTAVITAGRLEHFLYDTYTALKSGTVSTGNASRAGFKSSPGSGTSNFYLSPGASSRDEIIKKTRGLYLYDVMGLHMADPVSGDFSVGVLGAWLEGGEFKSGVRGITLAGSLLELLKHIDAVCEDLTFFGSLGSPTFRVSELMVSGA